LPIQTFENLSNSWKFQTVENKNDIFATFNWLKSSNSLKIFQWLERIENCIISNRWNCSDWLKIFIEIYDTQIWWG